MSRHGNCTHCFKTWHDGMTCDFAAGHREAYDEIVAKLRERAKQQCAPYHASNIDECADWIEKGCP